MSIKVWIDADSCPTLVRNHVVKYCRNINIPVTFVANKPINAELPYFEMIICPQEKDSADNFILSHAAKNDLVITRDILFADRLVSAEITVINDRGTEFTKDNIKDKVADRDFDLQLAEIGLGGSKNSNYGPKQFKKFANCFDKVLHHLIINQ